MAGSTLKVDGVDYDIDGRRDNSLAVDAFCAWDLDDDCWLQFHEHHGGSAPRFRGVVPVEYRDAGGVLRFKGVSTGAQPSYGSGRTWGYQCLGLKYLMDQISVQAPDYSGMVAYNLPATDEESVPTRRGKSIGEIISAVLTMHASQLAAIGVATDSTTDAQLAALTLVPHDPVYISGERLASTVESALRQHARNSRLQVMPSGLIRFPDVSAPSGASHTLTIGVDAIDPPLLSRDWRNAYSRVVVYGKARVFPFNGRMAATPSELQAAWSSGQQAAWKDSDFTQPGDASDFGVVTTTSGPSTITVQSDDPARTWPANFWNHRNAWVQLRNTTGTGLSYQANVPVTACTALTAGGTSTLTLGIELENSASDAWETYQLVGTTGPLVDVGGGTSLNNVWRLFNVVTPGGQVEDHLALSSPVELPFYGLNNASTTMTQSPSAVIVQNGVTSPATFRVLPETGQILFDEPVVRAFNSAADLAVGGGVVSPPDDILFMVPYARGPLELAYPPDVGGVPQHAGSAHVVDGVTRTKYAYAPAWQYEGNSPVIQQLAEMLHKSVCDPVVEGEIRIKGTGSDFWDPGDGHKVSIAASCGATGDESLDAPVRACVVRFNPRGQGPVAECTLRASTRRDPRTGEDFFLHLSQPGRGASVGLPMDSNAVVGGAVSFGGMTDVLGDVGFGSSSPMDMGWATASLSAPMGDPGRYSSKRADADRAAQRRSARLAREGRSASVRTKNQAEQARLDALAADGPTVDPVSDKARPAKERAYNRRQADSQRRANLAASRRRRVEDRGAVNEAESYAFEQNQARINRENEARRSEIGDAP